MRRRGAGRYLHGQLWKEPEDLRVQPLVGVLEYIVMRLSIVDLVGIGIATGKHGPC